VKEQYSKGRRSRALGKYEISMTDIAALTEKAQDLLESEEKAAKLLEETKALKK